MVRNKQGQSGQSADPTVTAEGAAPEGGSDCHHAQRGIAHEGDG
jgi:hypothetical protein